MSEKEYICKDWQCNRKCVVQMASNNNNLSLEYCMIDGCKTEWKERDKK